MKKKLLEFIFPKFCLHCSYKINDKNKIFCTTCQELLTLIEQNDHTTPLFPKDHLSSALEYIGPAKTLIKQLKYNNMPYLAKGAAAMMAKHFLTLGWPLPDLIVPVPQTLPSRIVRGYNQSFLLAKDLSKILNRPCKNILQKHWQTPPQTTLDHKVRKQPDLQKITLKTRKSYENKTILLIDDVITTGATLDACATALLQHYSTNLYALTLCC